MTRMQAAQTAPKEVRRLGWLTGATFDGATYASWGYLLAGLPLGILWFSLLVPLYLVGAVLIVVWVGLALLAFTQALSRWIGLFERWFAQKALGAVIAEPDPVDGRTLVELGRAHLSDEFGYRTLAWSVVRVITGTVGFVVAVVAFALPLGLTFAPVVYIWGVPPTWAWTPIVSPLLGVPAFFGAAHLIRLLGRGNARLAEIVLRPPRAREAQEVARRAERAEERLRIDQELHDSIGHVLTMNVVQAGAGAHVFDEDPEFAREALTNIERRGRAALEELDRIIGLVRSDEVTRRPLHGLSDIPELVAQIREAGMEIEDHIDPVETAPEIGRAAYGVAQEALTNVAKHAPGARTRVVVAVIDGWLQVEVANSAPSAPPLQPASGTGSGLTSIHHRVAILGGQSEAGPTPDGGFRVVASFPPKIES